MFFPKGKNTLIGIGFLLLLTCLFGSCKPSHANVSSQSSSVTKFSTLSSAAETSSDPSPTHLSYNEVYDTNMEYLKKIFTEHTSSYEFYKHAVQSNILLSNDQQDAFVYSLILNEQEPPIEHPPLIHIRLVDGKTKVIETLPMVDYAMSSGFSFNIAPFGEKFVVWGTYGSASFNFHNDTWLTLDCYKIEFITPKGTHVLEYYNKGLNDHSYIGILDAKPTDFKMFSIKGDEVLNLKKYKSLGHDLQHFPKEKQHIQ